MSDTLVVRDEQNGQLRRLILNTPKANVLDAEMVAALRGQLQMVAESSDKPKLLVFEGEGKHFSFGASVEEHLPASVAQMLEGFHAFFRELEALAIPTAAIVRGQCLGGGLEVAAFCGRVFAESSAVFAVPEIKLGVFPPIGALILPWRCGGARASELVISGRSVAAEEALAMGLVDELADDAEQALAAWWERSLAAHSAVALRFAWQAARRPIARALEEELPKLEKLYLEQLMACEDPVEGLNAFLERRPPQWRHR